jgi:hypothetical protein
MVSVFESSNAGLLFAWGIEGRKVRQEDQWREEGLTSTETRLVYARCILSQSADRLKLLLNTNQIILLK